MTTATLDLELQDTIKQLTERVDALEKSAGNDRLSIGVMSGNLDTTPSRFHHCIGRRGI